MRLDTLVVLRDRTESTTNKKKFKNLFKNYF